MDDQRLISYGRMVRWDRMGEDPKMEVDDGNRNSTLFLRFSGWTVEGNGQVDSSRLVAQLSSKFNDGWKMESMDGKNNTIRLLDRNLISQLL
ncbi:hypothetical protein Bca4012_065579 [Brassica carinata]